MPELNIIPLLIAKEKNPQYEMLYYNGHDNNARFLKSCWTTNFEN